MPTTPGLMMTPIQFGGRKDRSYQIGQPNPIDKATEKHEKAAERKKKVQNAVGLSKVWGTFTLAVGALATAIAMPVIGISGDTAEYERQDAEYNLEAQMPDVKGSLEVTPVNTDELTEVGQSVYGTKGAHVQTSPETLKMLDEAYAQIIYDATAFADKDISPADLAKRIDILESKKPQVEALVQQLYDQEQLQDPEALFKGLTEIFKDDMTPEQVRLYEESVDQLLDENDLVDFANEDRGFATFFGGLVVAAGLAGLGVRQARKQQRSKRFGY